MDTGTIYIATNVMNGKQYVGQTIDFKQRLMWHLHSSSKHHFGRAIRKHGQENFEFEQLEYPAEELNQWEKYWIAQLGTFSPGGYNHTTGGDCFKMSEATKEKISKNNARHRLGLKMSKEFCDNCSKRQIGVPFSEERKRALCGRIPWNKGKETPKETKARQSIAASQRDSHPCTKETKKKIGDAQRGEKNHMFGKPSPRRGVVYPREVRQVKNALIIKHALPENTKQAILDEYLAGSFIYAIAKKYSMGKKRISKIIHNQTMSQGGIL